MKTGLPVWRSLLFVSVTERARELLAREAAIAAREVRLQGQA